MKKIISTIILTCVCLFAFAEEEQKSFANLQEAIKLITEALENNDHNGLKKVCVGKNGKPANFPDYTFKNLKKLNKKKSLVEIYKDKIFPKGKKNFKLGGHMKELGCIHIDFIKKDDKWYIQDIWTCR